MKESGLRDRVVDVAEELYKFSLLVGATPLHQGCAVTASHFATMEGPHPLKFLFLR